MQKEQALQGVKVADFSWVITGPLATKYLADHGATVVRVESKSKLDLARAYIPYAGGIPGVNRCAFFAAYNSNKYSITLNLNHSEGIEIARRLIAWADLVIENFMPETMEGWGLGYEELKKIKPDIIMIRASMQGQTGPYASQPGFGTMMQASAGFTRLVGWQDRPPAGTAIPYTDFIAPWYIVIAALGALDYRGRTGKGQCIDLSQLEAAISFLSPAILDYTVNRRVQDPMGNCCPYAAPHGAYRCKGEDRWCAIAVFNDEEWKALVQVMGNPEWSQQTRFATLLGRKENEEELDRLVEEWTINYPPEEVMQVLQEAGVAAGLVENGKDLHQDPQLKHRHHFWLLKHPEMGVTAYDGPSFRLSETPAELNRAAPCLGEHTEYVCREILGMSDEEFVALLAEGVLE